MIDNFEKILPLLEYDNDDIFYSIEIIQRKKDNKNPAIRLGKNNNSRSIKSYYITSNKMLLDLKLEMTTLADAFNSRISINLNKKSFKLAAHETNQHIAKLLKVDNFKYIKNSYNKSVAKSNIQQKKKWIIDIDEEDMHLLDDITNYINFLYSEAKKYNSGLKNKIITYIPSKTGMHIIANPFNSLLFKKKYTNIDIKTNSTTNLYIP